LQRFISKNYDFNSISVKKFISVQIVSLTRSVMLVAELNFVERFEKNKEVTTLALTHKQ